MENFAKFEIENAQLVFGGKLHDTTVASTGACDKYDDINDEVYILD